MPFDEDALNPDDIISYLKTLMPSSIISNYTNLNQAACNNHALTILDFKSAENTDLIPILQQSLRQHATMLLFNTQNADALTAALGINIPSDWMLVQPYRNYTVITTSSAYDVAVSPTQTFNDTPYNTSNNQDDIPDCNHTAASQIYYGLTHSDIPVNDLPPLPPEQYKRYYWRKINYSKSLNTTYYTQQATIAVTLEITAFISGTSDSTPRYKYVQVRTLGPGCDAHMIQNTSTYRGYFQGRIHFEIYPTSDLFRLFSAEPLHVSNQSSYTASSSFIVDVDVFKYPTLPRYYEVSESLSANIDEFNIENKSKGKKAEWDFTLDYVSRGIDSLFNHKTFKHDTIKELPVTAIHLLNPLTNTVWIVDGAYTGNVYIGGNFQITYYEAWTTQAAGHINELTFITYFAFSLDMVSMFIDYWDD